MSVEVFGETQQEHEGEKYLRLLGFEDHVNKLARHRESGKIVPMRDFIDHCGEHVLPALKGLECQDPSDPMFISFKEDLVEEFNRRMEIIDP
ncbi:MAG TPA: hypothetical protein VLF63_02550 [Patescibacteria group bacterium]|nr:hypothetical protein [Patescibacteria group bacterium]